MYHSSRGKLIEHNLETWGALWLTCATRQKLFHYSRVISNIEYWLRLSMFDNVSYAVYSDYFVGWIIRIKSLWGILQLQRL